MTTQPTLSSFEAPIDCFDGEFAFLSNFFPSPVTLPHPVTGVPKVFPTVEHAFQAAKTLDPDEWETIRAQPTPGKAKRAGRKATMRPDWDQVKLSVMERLVEEKFSKRRLAELLLATGERPLIEGNTWGDRFWGVCDGQGENHLGRILMRVRHRLRSGETAGR